MQKDFQPDPDSAFDVRRFVTETLPQASPLDDIVLAASELATNVIRHAQTSYTVRVELQEGHVRLEVSDGSSIVPAVEDLVDSKRGLRIINAVSQNWGIEGSENGKTVWVDFEWTSPQRRSARIT